MSHELLLKNGLVVTVDDKLGDLQDADVPIRDGVIVAVGPGDQVRHETPLWIVSQTKFLQNIEYVYFALIHRLNKGDRPSDNF